MSNRHPREKFNYKSWFDRNVVKRTEAALAECDAAFAEEHAETPLNELAQYLARNAGLLRHTPSPCEVDGGAFIEQRFGSWEAALEMAELPPVRKVLQLKETARYQAEKKIQEPLFFEESERKKKEKRARSAIRRAAQEAKLKEKREREKKEARDTAACQREAEKAAQTQEPAGTSPSQAETV